ncbi:hypothetical protein CXB51_028646 [Gossypium anomalum]|uniref:Acylamino-acid-releasing enzyme N-terminal domain-containing protein n=1 Tax=Gossypium anomalum TaxID=47600 RepID=A0A8J6CQG2_9ROSI|nr:hypothetical protein CXB51_028646 [Gossypium anomalum]
MKLPRKNMLPSLNYLQEFAKISSIDKTWVFKSESGIGSQAMFSISQPNLLANKKRKSMLSTSISKESNNNVNFQWAPFLVEMTRVSITVPSPSGSKLLVIRNLENESPTQFEIWSSSRLEKEFRIPQSTHGLVYADGWFWGISWNSDESLIAYVAEEPSPCKPSFDCQGYKQGAAKDKECMIRFLFRNAARPPLTVAEWLDVFDSKAMSLCVVDMRLLLKTCRFRGMSLGSLDEPGLLVTAAFLEVLLPNREELHLLSESGC